jgi:hypothetical protein
VPAVTAFDGDRAADPQVTVRGTGFSCGQTEVLVNGQPVPSTEILSLTCGAIVLANWPLAGATLTVRTPGGLSASVTVP